MQEINLQEPIEEPKVKKPCGCKDKIYSFQNDHNWRISSLENRLNHYLILQEEKEREAEIEGYKSQIRELRMQDSGAMDFLLIIIWGLLIFWFVSEVVGIKFIPSEN
jgi:hypothetical protein